MLGRVRPVYNTLARVAGFPPLPPVGEHLRSAYLCCLAVEDDDPGVFAELLTANLRTAAERGYHYMLAGLSEGDPLLESARALTHIAYRSSMYAFSFDLGPEELQWDRKSVPYIEIAAL